MTLRSGLVKYDPLEDSFFRQSGGALEVYSGRRVLKGGGIGSFLSGIMRRALPVLKRGAVSVGKSALGALGDMAGDVLAGENVGASAKKRFTEAGGEALRSVTSALRGDGEEGPPGRRPPKRRAPPLRVDAPPEKKRSVARKKKKTRRDPTRDIFR